MCQDEISVRIHRGGFRGCSEVPVEPLGYLGGNLEPPRLSMWLLGGPLGFLGGSQEPSRLSRGPRGWEVIGQYLTNNVLVTL